MKRSFWFLVASTALIFGCTSMQKDTSSAKRLGGRNIAGSETRAGLDGWLSPSENAKMWGEYCIGDANNPAIIPKPNYENEFIKNLVLPKLRQVGDKSYYLYGDVVEVYQLRDSKTKKLKPVSGLPNGISPTANAFLVYLCGEFRDRATMIKEKLNWVANIYKLPTTEQIKNVDPKVSPWAQLSAHGYHDYLQLSADIFNARKATMGKVSFGSKKVDTATDGFTVCTVKYMLSEYIAKQTNFYGGSTDESQAGDNKYNGAEALAQFEAGYKNFEDKCNSDDKDYYYDFRGDSNFKPNSPESNAMIWASTTMAKMCENPVKAKAGNIGNVTDEQCREYFTRPFETRWNRARQGLMTWLFHPDEYEDQFADTKQLVVVYPNMPTSKYGPLKYNFELSSNLSVDQLYSSFMKGWGENHFAAPDMGFNSLFISKGNQERAYTLLQQAVDRHTDWYASGYDDQRGKQMSNSYSPFVASSYEPSKSDAFIACGYTVPCGANADTRKQWMFVFKVHKDNWYRTQDLANNKPINFTNMWLDETSFGLTDLAKAENAFDHMGTALEGEYDSIMYVHNLQGENVIDDELMFDNPYEWEIKKNEMLSKNKFSQAPALQQPRRGIASTKYNKSERLVRSAQIEFARPDEMIKKYKGTLGEQLLALYKNHVTPFLPKGVNVTFDKNFQQRKFSFKVPETKYRFKRDYYMKHPRKPVDLVIVNATFEPAIEEDDLKEVIEATGLKWTKYRITK